MSGRVLIADDDRAIRESLARALALEGYDVVQANDGAVALQMVESSQPDVAVLDVILRDEIGHVAIGNRWFAWLCEQRGLDPVATFVMLAHNNKVL